MTLEGYCTSVSRLFHASSLCGEEWEENPFLVKFYGGEINLCVHNFWVYRVVSMRNLSISVVLGNSYLVSCNFNFRCNLIDSNIVLLERLMSSLTLLHLSLFSEDSRAWYLSSFGLFSVRSLFIVLSKSLNPIPSFWLILFGNQKPLQSSRPLLG